MWLHTIAAPLKSTTSKATLAVVIERHVSVGRREHDLESAVGRASCSQPFDSVDDLLAIFERIVLGDLIRGEAPEQIARGSTTFGTGVSG